MQYKQEWEKFKYTTEKKYIDQLMKLSPLELLDKCRNDIMTSKLVLSLDSLLDKFGANTQSITKVPLVPFYANKPHQSLINTGYYLFEFLKLHKSIYEDAKKLDILDRLSRHQQGVLNAYFDGTIDEFIRENCLGR